MTDYKIQDLKRMCRERAIKGFSRKRKTELLELLGLNLSSQPTPPTLEKIVLDVCAVLFPENLHRMETRFMTRLQTELENLFDSHHLFVVEKRGSDFILNNNKRMSIRGSLQSKYIYPEQMGIPLEVEPKSWIIDHIHILLPQYLEQIVGDYFLWIDEKTAKCELFTHPRDLFFRDLTFNRKLDKWKCKNSVKMSKLLIGDFISIEERIIFRFNTLTLIRLFVATRAS